MGRPKDVVGIGGAINALTPVHRDFIAAGGMGLLIGDGRLRYSPERIFESYYALSLQKDVTLTFDYQRIAPRSQSRLRPRAARRWRRYRRW